MKNLENDIAIVKNIIESYLSNNYERNLKPFSKYAKTYYSTNENIAGYLEFINNSSYHNVISVLASGDQMFNLITKGFLNIDTFDINIIAFYFTFGLKLALILKYSYKDYLEISSKIINEKTTLNELSSIIIDLLPLMDYDSRRFWQEIINYNYKLQKNNLTTINLFNILCQNTKGFKRSIRGNLYLKNKEEYQILKNNLNNVNIRFYLTDVKNLPNNKYDLMLLSNIITYYKKMYDIFLDKKEYQILIANLTQKMQKDGIIFLNYLFENEVYKEQNNINHLKNFDLETLSVNPLSYLYDEDMIILKRIK